VSWENRTSKFSKGSGRKSTLSSSLSLLAGLAMFAKASQAAQPGPTVGRFQASFAGAPLRQVSPSEFNRYVALHGSSGVLLTGAALLQATAAAPPAASKPATESSSSPAPVAATPVTCWNPDSLKRRVCLDSLARLLDSAAAAARRDSLIRGPGAAARGNVPDTLEADFAGARAQSRSADATDYEGERTRGWFAQFFYDMGHEGGGKWDAGDWAAVIYVVVGVVVVGAFIVYGVQAVYDLAVNKDRVPVFKELGLRFSYSGKAYRDDAGPPLYRDAYLAGLRFAVGLDRGVLGLGLAAEGGYIDLALRGVDDPSHAFDFRGGYLVAGPMIRFGHNNPLSFNLEFLNGTSDHRSIGWITKSRMAIEGRIGPGFLLGAHLGAVFYDLHFLDGLAVRSGDFNRDLSIISGLDAGWEF
jgi:hypothetical protein